MVISAARTTPSVWVGSTLRSKHVMKQVQYTAIAYLILVNRRERLNDKLARFSVTIGVIT